MKKFFLAAAIIAAGVTAGFSAQKAVMYMGDGCGCCGHHAEYLRKQGFDVVFKKDNFRSVRDNLGVPAELESCHSTVIGGYVVEGHAPIEPIRWLLREKPKGVIGVAVGGMPVGAPGMEYGNETEDYYVIILNKNGKQEPFALYNGHKIVKKFVK